MLRNLAAEMVRHGVSRQQLAEKLGISKKSMDNKMRGDTKFRPTEKMVTCSVLGMDYELVKDLLFEQEEKDESA